MDYDMGAAAAGLRQDLRALARGQLPADFVSGVSGDPTEVAVTNAFCRKMAEIGLLCLAWPEKFGGRNASMWEQTIVREEMWAANEPRGPQYMGVNWVGPILMRHGTDAQQRQHLPAIAHGEVIWCQGFSEPDAGSDLASVRTAAESDGDSWVISGQKIWTSYAVVANWCFLLARTSRTERKHDGLTIFLVPMSDSGIEVRPIPSIIGAHHLNEVFFDAVRLPADSILGAEGAGWQIVQDVMSYERVGIARYARCERMLLEAPRRLGPAWDALPADLRMRWARAVVLSRRARLMAYRVVAAQDSGVVSPSETAAYRIAVTTLEQETADVLMEVVTLFAAHDPDLAHFAAEIEEHWRFSQASTVASGSIEIQRILLSRAMLAAS
jgi:alkylation response protein AidB-like acyl-CoA dehydrogenase